MEDRQARRIRADRLRALDEMVAGLAHQLNQPLSGVRGLAEHLLIGIDRGWKISESKVREKLQLIVEQADRMVQVIDHMRRFTEEAGRSELRLVQINEVVETSRDILRSRFQSRGLGLSVELAQRLPPVLANPYSLEEAILNLMTNARQALEERARMGSAAIHQTVLVRTSASPAGPDPAGPDPAGPDPAGPDPAGPGRQLKVEVIDSGVGIPEEIVDKVFDPFFTTRGPDAGLGLGLSITKFLVEETGGCVEIQSHRDRGTVATILLPATTPPEEDQ